MIDTHIDLMNVFVGTGGFVAAITLFDINEIMSLIVAFLTLIYMALSIVKMIKSMRK